MSVTKLNQNNLDMFISCMEKLKPDSPRKWGTLDPARMLIHIHNTFKLSLEEKECLDISNFLTRTKLFRLIFFELLPVPRGKIKVPAVFTPEPEDGFDFETEKRDLVSTMQRFVEILEKNPDRKSRNPVLGIIDFRYWSIVHGNHLVHHFKQFGIF